MWINRQKTPAEFTKMVTTIPSLRVAFCVPNETGASSESSSGWLDMKTNQGFRGCVQSVVRHLTSQQVTVKRYLLSTYKERSQMHRAHCLGEGSCRQYTHDSITAQKVVSPIVELVQFVQGILEGEGGHCSVWESEIWSRDSIWKEMTSDLWLRERVGWVQAQGRGGQENMTSRRSKHSQRITVTWASTSSFMSLECKRWGKKWWG